MASAAQTIQWGPAFRTVTTSAWPAGVPKPVRQCDGSYRTPAWDPEKREWEMQTYEMGLITRLLSRATCGDAECSALHEEDFKPADVVKIRAGIAARRRK